MWPQEYIELKHIENLLVCGICYEYIKTSVITSCSHNYCSLCIRKYLHYKTQCPACFAETFEKDLRKNKVLDEIIAQFLQVKDKLKTCLQNQMQFLSYNRSDVILNIPKLVHKHKDKHLIKKKTLRDDKIIDKNLISENNASSSTNVQKDLNSPSTSGKSRIPLMFTPKSTKRPTVSIVEETVNVLCPVCKVTISELHINRHLDDCLKRATTKDPPQIVDSNRKPLPKLVFSLMKDAVVRKKLKEFGLSSHGDRKVMEARLQRYIVLYNAECDKSNPRVVSELVKQCEDEENLERKMNKTLLFTNKFQFNRHTEQNVIDEERKKYLETYKDSFDNLIKKIKCADPPRMLSVRRSLLNESIQINESISHKHHQSMEQNSDDSVNEMDKNDFLPINAGEYIEDSDSDSACPLQMYSSTASTKLLNVELSSNNHIPKNKYELNYKKHVDQRKIKSEKIEKNDANSDTFGDISVSNKEVHSIIDTTLSKNISKTDSKNACNISNYKMLLQMKNKLSPKAEMREMDSVTTSREDFDSINVLDQEEADEKSISVLQNIVCDLPLNDSIDSKHNYENSHLNNSTVNLSNLEKENVNSSPECSGSRWLRKRSRDLEQNDKIVLNAKKKYKKSSQCHHSETDKLNNEESLRTLNGNEKKHLQKKSRLRKQVSSMAPAEEAIVLRKSARSKLTNNI